MSSQLQSSETQTIHRLILFGLIYNVAEGILSIAAGIRARSIVLVGFGLDSGIEAIASFAALRYIKRQPGDSAERELSTVVGWTFMVLSAYVVIQSIYDLAHRRDVEPSLLGFAVTLISLLVMPALGFWKLRIARVLGSRGLQSEAKETIACSYLSLFAVLGTGIRYFGGPSWIDPVAALMMLPWLIKEGIEGIRGEES